MFLIVFQGLRILRGSFRSTRKMLDRERAALLAIAGIWVAAISIVGLGPDVPLQDDWTYAWSVEHVLETGRFAVLPWSLHFPVFQTAWAAGFAAIFGFSFPVLRASTLLLALIGAWLLYLTMRELEVDRRTSSVATFTFFLNPIVFFLSFTFMTDVPFVTLTILAVFAFVAAHTRQRPFWLWVGAAASIAAFLTRQIGIVTPVAGVPLVLAAWPDRRLMARRALPLATAWGVMAVSTIGLARYVGTTSYMTSKLENLQWLLLVRAGDYFDYNLWSLVHASFALLPLLAALLPFVALHWRAWIICTGVAGSVLLLRFGRLPTPLTQGDSWSVVELGSSLALMPGGAARELASWLDPTIVAAGFVATGAVVTLAWQGLRSTTSVRAPIVGVALLLTAHLVVLNVLWLYSDRYLMMMLPLALILIACVTRRTRLTLAPAIVTLTLWAAIDGVGTRYAMKVNDVALNTWHALNDAGVPPWDIDAGYAINGWMLYAHPQRLAAGMDRERDVPFVTAARSATWLIAHSPVEGYAIVREVSWPEQPWPRRHRLYVLRKTTAEIDR
jgi:hypothetical protein